MIGAPRAAAVVLAAVLFACSAPPAPAFPRPRAEAVAAGFILGELRAQQALALDLYRAGIAERAAIHAWDRVIEDLRSLDVTIPVADRESGRLLRQLMDDARAVRDAIERGAPPADVEQLVAGVVRLSPETEQAIVGDQIESHRYRASVIHHLLRLATEAYESGVADDRVVAVEAYRDAFGLTREVSALYAGAGAPDPDAAGAGAPGADERRRTRGRDPRDRAASKALLAEAREVLER